MWKRPATPNSPPAPRLVLLLTVGIERPSGRRYFALARELVRRGYRVRVLALHPDLASCPRRRFVQDGVEVWYVGQMHARKTGTHPTRFGSLALLRVVAGATWGMLRGILASPAELYHLGKPQPINGLAAVLGVLLLRRQRFYVDCDDDETATNRFTAGWQRAVFAFWQSILPRLACGLTVNTRYLEQHWRQHSAAPICYVPNGVDPATFCAPPPDVQQGLRRALLLEGCRVIAYVGTLALHNHPVDLLLHAFEQVLAEQPTARLLLIGGGEDLPLLQAQVRALGLQGRVLFTGHLPHAVIPAYLSLAELSVDPVRDDPVARARSPLKIVESMVLGVPVITGNVGDRAAMLDDGRAGVLVAPGDARALAAAINTLLSNPTLHRALHHAAQQHARQHYTWVQLAAQWATIYPHDPAPDLARPLAHANHPFPSPHPHPTEATP
ncbi:MAG: glycosyltransferase family 4 protein [Chloroflexaceae bacterium]|nr:glycosyltransferase family 4 protein [Chloroflexaceae bacterium]